MRGGKQATASHPRGRGTYNAACDVCARKKTKCDGIKPVCQPCINQGREQECSWSKNPVKKPRTEQHFEALYKRGENLRARVEQYRKYADYLEALLDECQREHFPRHNIDFRAARPQETDNLLGPSPDILDHDFDHTVMGAEGNGEGSDSSDDPMKEICLPTQTLKIEDGIYGNTAPFRFEHAEASMPSRIHALADNQEATHILLVDGVDEEHSKSHLDWSRHLPSAIPLDRRSHDKALDLLFKFFTSWCFRIVPPLFLRDMYRYCSVPHDKSPPKTPHYSPMLHNALISLGLAFLDEPRFSDIKVRQFYANTAKSFIETECRKPNLSVVNALSILASFHSSQGDQTLGYMYFGMSARMSQALGLNVDVSDWVKSGLMDDSDQHDRRWANWTTFTQDVCWSLYVGRDFCVSGPLDLDGKTVIAPFVDTEFDQMPWVHAPSGIGPQPNYLTKTFQATCELLLISRRIMDVVNGLSRARNHPAAMDELISDIDLKLNTWRGRLASELEITVKSRSTATPHKLMLHLAYWWLFILLHRPFFHRKSKQIYSSDREIDHVKLCRRAAENIMELTETWRSLYGLRFCPVTLIQTVFSAGTVYLLTAIQAGSGIRLAQKELSSSLDKQKLVMTYLHEIGKSWQGASNIANILKGLMEEQVKPILERKPIPITIGTTLQSADYGNNDHVKDTHTNSSSKPSALTRALHRHPSISKSTVTVAQQPRRSHPRTHSVNQPTPPIPSTPLSTSASHSQVSSSPTITISPVQSSFSPAPSHPKSTSIPPGSSPIAIKSPRSANSLFSSSPSNLSDPWSIRSTNVHTPSPSTSPVFPGNYASSSPSPSTSFVHHLSSSLKGHSPLATSTSFEKSSSSSSVPFLTEPYTVAHVFQGQGSPFGNASHHTFSNDRGKSNNYQYPGNELSGVLGMLGGQTLPQAPFMGLVNFTDVSGEQASPQEMFSPSPTSSSAPFGDRFFSPTQGSPSYVDLESFMINLDTNMDESGLWSQATFD